MEPGWVWGEEGGQGMVCECLREALKEEENKGDAVTGEGNKKKQLCIKKHTYFLLSSAAQSPELTLPWANTSVLFLKQKKKVA